MESKLRKVIVVSDAISKAIENICNAALKHEGLPMIASVNAIKNSIKDENSENSHEDGDV